MKFTTREDIEATVETVFAALSDFAEFERAAERRGAEVTRKDPAAAAGPGLIWTARFPVRGKMRKAVVRLATYEPSTAMLVDIEGTGFSGSLALDLVALSRGRTRLTANLEIKPQSLKARFLIQSVRLTRAAHQRRFDERLQKFAAEIELRQAQRRGA